MGKPGYVKTVSARWDENSQLGISFGYLPKEYAINEFVSADSYSENFYSARVGLTKFFEFNLTITRLPEISDQIGVGDRHLDFRFLILKETDKLPGLVVSISSPFGERPMLNHDFFVFSKSIKLNRYGEISVSVGYGSPFYLGKAPRSIRLSTGREFGFFKKSLLNNYYLVGPFGGFHYSPIEFFGFAAEYDGQYINYSSFFTYKKRFFIQGSLIDHKSLSLNFGANFSLNLEPYELRKALKSH